MCAINQKSKGDNACRGLAATRSLSTTVAVPTATQARWWCDDTTRRLANTLPLSPMALSAQAVLKPVCCTNQTSGQTRGCTGRAQYGNGSTVCSAFLQTLKPTLQQAVTGWPNVLANIGSHGVNKPCNNHTKRTQQHELLKHCRLPTGLTTAPAANHR